MGQVVVADHHIGPAHRVGLRRVQRAGRVVARSRTSSPPPRGCRTGPHPAAGPGPGDGRIGVDVDHLVPPAVQLRSLQKVPSTSTTASTGTRPARRRWAASLARSCTRVRIRRSPPGPSGARTCSARRRCRTRRRSSRPARSGPAVTPRPRVVEIVEAEVIARTAADREGGHQLGRPGGLAGRGDAVDADAERAVTGMPASRCRPPGRRPESAAGGPPWTSIRILELGRGSGLSNCDRPVYTPPGR